MVRQSTKVKDKFRDRFITTKSVQQETTRVKELKEKIKELENSSLLTETSTFAEINLQLQIETETAVKLLRNIVYRSSRDIALEEAITNYYLEERY